MAVASPTYSSAIFLVTLPSELIGPPHHLANALNTAAAASRTHLYVVFISPLFTRAPESSQRRASWVEVQRLLAWTYVHTAKQENPLFDVDVLLKPPGEPLPNDVEHVFHVEGDASLTLPSQLSKLPSTALSLDHVGHPVQDHHDHLSSVYCGSFPVVALGGTFDHLHAGHKILLSMGAWLASRKLIVGVTDDALLKSKKHQSVLEPIDTRIARSRAFVEKFAPGIEPYVVPINDVYGPTGWDPDVQALVVSRETKKGGDAVAKHRAEHNLPALETFIIDVISDTDADVSEEDMAHAKTSSTLIREWIVQQQHKGSRDTI